MTASDLIAEAVSELGLPPQLHFQLQFESAGENPFTLAGPERLLAIVLSHVDATGQRLSAFQLEHIDTCPLIHCRFVLRSLDTKRRSASQWVTQFR